MGISRNASIQNYLLVKHLKSPLDQPYNGVGIQPQYQIQQNEAHQRRRFGGLLPEADHPASFSGYIYMGLGLATEAGSIASLYHVLSHGATKSLLFVAAAVWATEE